MAQGMDARGKPLLTIPLPAGIPGGQVVSAVLLVDPQGNPMVMPGAEVVLDPPGPYTRLVDDAGDGVLYIGEAIPGTQTAAAAWRIQRVRIMGDDVTKEFAASTPRFSQVWDNRASLQFG